MPDQIYNNIPDFRTLLKNQGYSLVGNHSAVKTCLWLKRSIKDEGACYKSRFYGIKSHCCIQMTPTLLCNQKCIHCWRPTEIEVPAPEEWDSPVEIMGSSIYAQRKLISGFGGSAPRERWMEANKPEHAAISLSGEPTLYPYLPELIDEFTKEGITTFVVTNGTRPEMITRIRPTQLYLSLDAPDKNTYLEVCNPESPELWENIKKSLSNLYSKDVRTVVRITLIKGVNMYNPEGFAELINTAKPDFVEIKAYMHLGFSRGRLSRESMPSHDEVYAFASKIADYLDYEVADNVEISRVVLLSRPLEPLPGQS
ncbi:Wyosine base formation domain protein [Methanohalobium evestigatum Z-7303]|uniref:S-adenosyl-L-methionine-dependent tRNA 4-demethylwyosine synthase n=1 Tax=Methanohalobium evestigatum (strain ATCC BAA-1072 / DSM 3721 / NBRC 107634 / OCM 161 / Z-7303) TaxID=644295 RepID=D7E5R6_METEZ|nr:4-demethylwyosine synthase TYW1 [Methanohalobium evestigatum]ADI72938.1 Wyosine base formation domain protein [Methanohalobium evestigatum Z-7303]